jgi:hypothetical protein
MVLLPEVQTLILQLLHHLIKHIDHPVRLRLPDLSQAGTKVLLFQQLHTVTDDMQGLYDTAIKDK